MRKRIYCSGPISKGDIHLNIEMARVAMKQLIRAGFAVLAPQLACYLDGDVPKAGAGGFTHAEWLSNDLSWVAASDAVLRLPGESIGADMETKEAEYLAIPVFHSIEDLVSFFDTEKQWVEKEWRRYVQEHTIDV